VENGSIDALASFGADEALAVVTVTAKSGSAD
jgi:hypothetical protein